MQSGQARLGFFKKKKRYGRAGFAAGSYTLSESGGPAGYIPSDWVCVGGTQEGADTINLALGEAAICTITNDDTDSTSLTLVKKVVNNKGCSASPSAWTLIATGPTGFSGSGPNVSNGANFAAGSYDLSESGGPAGYIGSDWVCVGGTQDDADTITLVLGEAAICTITNDDTDSTSLTLVKKVINNNGGTASPSSWALTASGPTGFSGKGPTVSSGEGFVAGSYDLSEGGGPTTYTASAWVCDGGTQVDADTISLALGEIATCTVTNDDISHDELIFKDGFE
jgi:hypothetical protein